MNRTQFFIRILALGSHSKVRLEPNPPSKISAGGGGRHRSRQERAKTVKPTLLNLGSGEELSHSAT